MADSSKQVALYAAIGPELTHYAVDVEGATLIRRGTVTLPANIHYAWPHASGRHLYVASSDSASGIGGVVGTKHHVTAWRIDPASGALSPHGEPIALPTRPIHMTLDIPSEHILVAFSNPSGLQVYRINPDMTPGMQVTQPEPIDAGIYGHQVRVSRDDKKVILVTRGHDAAGRKPEEPGALEAVGTVKLHPSGRFAYVANRASSTDQSGVFVGGENTLAVFAIDRASGEPQIIQHVDTRGVHCRNFHIDPSGRLLVASHIRGLPVRDGGGTRLVPACLSVFRIGEDGRLEFVRKYDVETGDRQMFWMGMVGL